MKKFSKVKYFGAVAAALLAVAPIAAPVVSQVASPAIAQAAVDGETQSTLTNSINPTVSAKVLGANQNGTVVANDVMGINTRSQVSQITSDQNAGEYYFIKNLLFKDGGAQKLATSYSTYDIEVKFDGNASGLTGLNLVNVLNNNPAASYNVTVNLYKPGEANVEATVTSKLNVANYVKGSVNPANATVGDKNAFSGLDTIASAVSLTNASNTAVPLTAADFHGDEGVTFTTANVAVGNVSTGDAADYFNTDGTFKKYGVIYSVAHVTHTNTDKFATLVKAAAQNGATSAASGVALSFAQAAAKGGIYSTSTNPTNAEVYIIRTINIAASTNDAARYPVLKYVTSVDGANSVDAATTYNNGDTIDGSNFKFTSNVDSDYANIARAIFTKISSTKAVGNFFGYRNSIKSNGLNTAVNGWANYTVAGATLADGANNEAAIANALHSYIKNPYITQTTNVPLTVTNSDGLKSTFNIPVTIGTNVGTPVATEFTGYTTIAKGDKFDALADVQFQNSSLDNGVIPSNRIKVSSNVDTSTPGTYTVTYTVTNAAGNSATFTRTVVVTAGDLTESNADGVVYINKADGATVYSDAATTKATDKKLDNTTAWKFHSVVKDAAGKTVAYNLGGKQYVKASEVSTSPVKAQAGVFTVNYPANSKWSIAVYNSDLKVVKLIPAKSSWLTFGTKQLADGKSYYNLGGNQWVRTDYGFWNAK